MIQIIGTKKCDDTRKAIRFFKERRAPFQFLDVGERNLSPGELKNIVRSITVDELIDREGREYLRKNLRHMKFDPAAALLENSLLLKTPVVRSGGKAVIGLRPGEWKAMADGE